MKKICILGTANIKHMTLISLYTEKLRDNKVDYDIIYIDKYHEKETYPCRELFRYELNIKKEWSFLKKLSVYWGFRKYAIDIIEKNKYDFIIVWNEFTAFMFADYLAKRYKGKYCVNIRDQNFNRNPVCQYRYKIAVNSSAFSTISSERFRTIFPKADYLFVHSYNTELLKGVEPVDHKREEGQPIRILFLGRMSYPDSKISAITSVGNDKRFELYFIGAGCGEFQSIVKDNSYSNVYIHDSFKPEDTSRFLENADIIFTLNKENDTHSDSLLPIKLYYAIAKCIPVLAYRCSFTYEYAHKHNFAIGVEQKDTEKWGDDIFEQYSKLSQEMIAEGCKNSMDEIQQSHKKLEQLIEKYIL